MNIHKKEEEKEMVLQFDESFIQESDHRPKYTITSPESIPLIDLSPTLTCGDHIPNTLVKQIEEACREWGFFQVINHGVPLELLERVQVAAKEFFKLSIEEKRKVKRDENNPLGYYDKENTKEVRDWKEVFDFIVNEPAYFPVVGEDRVKEIRNQWPEYPSYFRDACKEYQEAVEDLSYRLLKLISLSLNLPAKRLNELFEHSTSFIRLNYYPPCPNPDLVLGVGPHNDAGALTVLVQDDVAGLDVKRKSNGEWIRVNPVPNSYIINVGDVTQVWSNDKYESPVHRVSVNSEKERFSVPFFFNPKSSAMVKPLEELVDDQNPAKYDEFNWGEFLMARANSNYKKLGVENTQIRHYRKVQ